MDNPQVIQTQIGYLQSIGYSEQTIAQIIGHYTGYLSWQHLSANQQRRLVADLGRHVRIARRWHYAVTGYLQ